MKKLCIDCSTAFEDRSAEGRDRCFVCHMEHSSGHRRPFSQTRKRGVKNTPPPKEWREFLTEIPSLLQLCHPDKHNQSEGSVRLTNWLLEVRKRHAGKEAGK